MKRLCSKNRDFVVYGIHSVSPNLNTLDISFIIDNGKNGNLIWIHLNMMVSMKFFSKSFRFISFISDCHYLSYHTQHISLFLLLRIIVWYLRKPFKKRTEIFI